MKRLIATMAIALALLLSACGGEEPLPRTSTERGPVSTPGSVDALDQGPAQPALTQAEIPGRPQGATVANAAPDVTSVPEPDVTTDTPQAMEESDHVEYMVRLLALGDVREFWFVDLESIAADPELAPLLQNLVDTWNVWNKDSSEEFGLTLQDAAFAVSLPGQALFFGGIADVEGLRETLVAKGYEREEVQGVGYWTNPSGEGSPLMFLAHNVVLVPGTTSFLEDAGCFISDDSCWREGEWQRYRNEMDSALDIGSMDDLVSEIRSGLVFHFDGFDSQQYTFAKAGTTGGLTVKAIQVFPDEDAQKLAEAMADETTRQKLAEFMAYLFAIGSTQDCIDADLDWSGNPKIIATGVCPAESFEFGTANYFLSLR